MARRFLCAVLALALTHFGVVATAPAHAHEVETSHGEHAVTLDGHVVHDHTFADHHHVDVADDRGDEPVATEDSDAGGSHTIFHVHCFPHFAPADGGFTPVTQVVLATRLRPPEAFGAPTVSSAPPFRPPRTFL